VTDLAAIAAELLPSATWVTQAAPRQVAWVRVLRARVPAFDALDAGDLVVAAASALAVVAPGPAELDAFVAALAAMPVSGIVLVEGEAGPGGEPVPSLAGVEASLKTTALPAVRLPRTDLQELERSIVGFIVARGAELERQAALLEGELRRRALDGVDVATLLATVSGFLGRALALEGSRGESIAVHVPVDTPAAAADAARYRAAATRGRSTELKAGDRDAGPPATGVALRVPLPAAEGNERPDARGRNGALLALGAAPVPELVRVTLPRVAALLALELAQEEAVRRAADRARRTEPMPSAGPPWIVALAHQRAPGSRDDTPEAREATRRALRLLAPARRMSLRGDAESLEVRMVLAVDQPGGPDAEGRLAAGAIADLLGRTIAISRPFGASSGRPAAEAEARAALEAADGLPGAGPVVLAARLPVYRMLGALHHIGDAQRLGAAILEPLLASRPDVRREHLATLRAYLERGGVGEAAAALGIHRNTVAYRLHRIEELTGWDLADPDLRLAIGVALRVVQDH
jgi:purine catabolism regulator